VLPISQPLTRAFPGEAWEEWAAQRSCPSGLLLATPAGVILFNAAAESYTSWHDGEPFLEPTGAIAHDDPPPSTCAERVTTGVYEGTAPYGQLVCPILLEIDHAPSVRALPPFIRVQMLECAATATAAAVAAPSPAAVLVETADPIAAPAARRLLQAAGSGTAATVIVNMSAAQTVVDAGNGSALLPPVAAFASVAVPAAAAAVQRYWLIVAPNAVTLST
jgi:hypothetical protein